MARPDTFIIGAPKSGTTSLYDYLSGHPQVYMSPAKEPLYFCPDVRAGRSDHRLEFGPDEDAYMALFADARAELRRGEATTRYLVSHDAARLVHDFQPDAFAIAMLRNPIDVAHALHNERVSQGHEQTLDFQAALALDAERARGQQLPVGTNALGGVYRESIRYADGLERWITALGRQRVHVIVFDDFVRDPATEFRHVLEFLGVDPHYQPPTFAPRNASHRQRRWVRQIMDSVAGEWLTHDALGALIGDNRRARLALRFRHSRLNRRPAPRSPMPADLRHQLEAELRPDVERVSKLLGRNLEQLWFNPTGD